VVNLTGLLVVAIAALSAPLVAELIPGRLVPPVVLEVLAGVIIGPEVLGIAHKDVPLTVLSLMGLSFLLFLAGTELEASRLKSSAGRLGVLAFVVGLVLSVPAGILLKLAGAHGDLRLVALVLTSTSLGIVVPILRDAGESTTEFGQMVLVSASVAEFGSLLILTILFSADPKSTPEQIVYLVGLGASAIVMIVVIRWAWRLRWFKAALARMDDTTSQLRVRAAFVLLLLFASLVDRFGVDAVLGAFVAGVVLRAADRDDEAAWEHYMVKLNAIGYGFLVPVFFIATGLTLDVRSIFKDPHTLALVPLFLLGMIVVRCVPSWIIFRRRFDARTAFAAGAFEGTSLTFPIVAVTIGEGLHFVSPPTAAAMVAAGLLSVIVLPAIALVLRPWSERRREPAPT